MPIRGGCYAADLARGGRDVMRIAGHALLEPQERIVNAMRSLLEIWPPTEYQMLLSI